MTTEQEPAPAQVRALEQYLLLTVDHGFNASTFAAGHHLHRGRSGQRRLRRHGALSGYPHSRRGAPSRALDMLDRVDEPGNAERWVHDTVEHGVVASWASATGSLGPRIHGGSYCATCAQQLGGERVETTALDVESVVVRTLAELKPGKGLCTNVEF